MDDSGFTEKMEETEKKVCYGARVMRDLIFHFNVIWTCNVGCLANHCYMSLVTSV